jgi:hypothetical protein
LVRGSTDSAIKSAIVKIAGRSLARACGGFTASDRAVAHGGISGGMLNCEVKKTPQLQMFSSLIRILFAHHQINDLRFQTKKNFYRKCSLSARWATCVRDLRCRNGLIAAIYARPQDNGPSMIRGTASPWKRKGPSVPQFGPFIGTAPENRGRNTSLEVATCQGWRFFLVSPHRWDAGDHTKTTCWTCDVNSSQPALLRCRESSPIPRDEAGVKIWQALNNAARGNKYDGWNKEI